MSQRQHWTRRDNTAFKIHGAVGHFRDTVGQKPASTAFQRGQSCSACHQECAHGLLWGLRTALAWYDDPTARARLIANGMSADFSWQHQVPAYEELYRSLAR